MVTATEVKRDKTLPGVHVTGVGTATEGKAGCTKLSEEACSSGQRGALCQAFVRPFREQSGSAGLRDAAQVWSKMLGAPEYRGARRRVALVSLALLALLLLRAFL